MKGSVIVVLLAWLVFSIMGVEAREIGFIEDFSLAKDRAKALEQLIPGTEEYYFYHCLHAQHAGDSGQVHQLLEKWIERYGYTDRVREIRNRQALLDYKQKPEESLSHIRKTLGLRFDHQREKDKHKTDLPTALNPEHLSTKRFMDKALSRYKNLQGVEDAGLDILPFQKLTPEQRRHLLHRLKLPDLPGLPELVVADLKHNHSRGFGSHPIHRQLLRDQLDTCLKRMPDLLNHPEFVRTYLTKLAPDDDTDVQTDSEARRAWLERMWGFARKLAPAHNSLKTHLLYHLLDQKRRQGEYDQALLTEYLRLPRPVVYMAADYLERREFMGVQADLDADFSDATTLPPVYGDEALVRDHLTQVFVTAKNYKPYAKLIREDWLREVFATAKILNGLGDMEQWYSMISPDRYQALKERVDIAFAHTNPDFFGADEPVALELDIKNVRNLIVKIFEINAFNYYLSHQKEVDTAISLDGLTATWEKAVQYDEPPLRQVRRRFEFPEISTPGVFVAEFIGNGKSSRALIRKGRLSFAERITAAGHEFTVFDESRNKRPQAAIWMGGRAYKADKDGVIILPFSTRPMGQTIILKDGNRCSIGAFDHMAEAYALSARFHADAESLISGQKARVVMRPALTLNGHPVSLSLLEDVRLELASADRDGVAATHTVPGFKLSEEGESSFEFQVPDGLRELRFTLTGRVQNLSLGKKQDLSDETRFSVNGIDASEAVRDLFLSHTDKGYVVTALGKNGEPEPDMPVRFTFKHRRFRDPVNLSLKTGAEGRIRLHDLSDIEWVEAKGPAEITRRWHPAKDRCHYPASIHRQADSGFRVPYVGLTDGEPRLHYTLLEKRGPTWVANRTDAVYLRDGFLEIIGLPAGDYDLFLKESNTHIQIRLTDAKPADGLLISGHRMLETGHDRPLHIVSADAGKEKLTVQLANASDLTRLHVLATRFVPPFGLFEALSGLPAPPLRYARVSPPRSYYIAMRDIGDEYRYILERRYAEKLPGNMLPRPGLLLNPWSLRKTGTDRDEAKAGEMPESLADDLAGWGSAAAEGAGFAEAGGSLSDYDFLGDPPALLLNLTPDANGQVVIDRKALGGHQQIHLLAVDPEHTVYRELALPETKMARQDLRMVRRLEPDTHFTEQKRISVIREGETFRLSDRTTSDFEVYDSLDKLWQLLTPLSNNATLKEFRFVLRWPEMDATEKKEKYSKYACHELSFFLYHKDRAFFDEVVRPYLRNKKDKTFMDHWLLGEDLSYYTTDWAFGQLNTAEKILLLGRGKEAGPYVKKRFDLLPPDPDTYNRLFDTALRGRAFEEEHVMAFKAAPGQVMADKLLSAMPEPSRAYEAAPAPAAAPMPSDTDSDTVLEEADMVFSGKSVKKRRVGTMRKKDAAKREAVRRLYQKLDKTEEWAENNYYHRRIEEQTADLIQVSAFWNDYAASDPNQPFFSPHIAYATRNFAEMMLALSVTEMPFKAGEHEQAVRGSEFSLKAASPMIVFHKEILPARAAEAKIPVMAGQNFFRSDDRYRYVDNEQFDKFAEGEFLYRVPYGCQVVVSNPTSAPRKLRVLLQIPQGALPLKNGFYSKSVPVAMKPYGTWAFEYYFYFPDPGAFQVYPVQVARNEDFITSAPATAFQVVEALSETDTGSWAYVSQNGSDEQVLDFLRTQNPNRVALEKIAFRMKEKEFFTRCIALLRDLHLYNHTLWSYGIYHNRPEVMGEYLKHSEYADQCGLYLASPVLTVDPVARRTYQHLEYSPLINARAHQLGRKRKILNDRFYDQYQGFLKKLSYQPTLSAEDRLAVTDYLLLQDRVTEAMDFFREIEPEQVNSRIQYDYIRAYLDFYTETPEKARQIAETYADYPVDRWQKRFQNVLAQLDELSGKATAAVDEKDRAQVHEELAGTEASFDFTVESRRVTLSYRNMTRCRVNYYPMEIELLFSRNPFVQEQTGQFDVIRPAHTAEISLPGDQTSFSFDLPEQFRNSNLMVEIVADGIRKSRAYYANSLDVQVVETYGHLRVTHQETGQPLPRTYVKVYARMRNGEVRFYKDGYTDLRGRFDYVSLSTDELDRTEKFALLVLSEEHGAVIREAAPPKQ